MNKDVNKYVKLLVAIDNEAEELRQKRTAEVLNQKKRNEERILSLEDKLDKAKETAKRYSVDSSERTRKIVEKEMTNYQKHLRIQDERFSQSKDRIAQSLYEKLF